MCDYICCQFNATLFQILLTLSHVEGVSVVSYAAHSCLEFAFEYHSFFSKPFFHPVLTLYYSTIGLLKPTLVTYSNYLNLVSNKNMNFPDFSCVFQLITMILFLFIQRERFKSKMGGFDTFFEILPISGFRCKIFISRLIFMVEMNRIRVNWCSRLDGLQ